MKPEAVIVYAVIDTRDGSVVDVKTTRKAAREALEPIDTGDQRIRRARLTLFDR